jgi:hypothetical protein
MGVVAGGKPAGQLGEIKLMSWKTRFHSGHPSFSGTENGDRDPRAMRSSSFLSLLAWLLAALSGCSKSETPSAPNAQTDRPSPPAASSPARAPVDACSLLTSDEIKAIQGEAVESVKSMPASEGDVASSQCVFSLPTFVNSISLQISHKGTKPGSLEAKQVWQKMFPPEKREERETADGQKKMPARKIPDLGEEAFWTGGPTGGLFVLQGDYFIRISIGGADDEATKISKSTALAQLVLKRL